MIGSESIDFALGSVWKAWFAFRKGKRMSDMMHEFQYHLEKHLFRLYQDLNRGTYKHGPYKHFTVCDNKRREISVSSVRDRVVHRLLYDCLVPIWDKTFIYDAWSCRKKKGLLGAIERTQSFLTSYPRAYVWRVDIKKFFDNVDHGVLMGLLERRMKDVKALELIAEVLQSYSSPSKGVGMPIGNLTSQVFSNIYLNELDRFVKHNLKPNAYLRYGDDFVLFEMDKNRLENMRMETVSFLTSKLKLRVNPKNDVLVKAKHGLKFLGTELWPSGRRLTRRNRIRIANKLDLRNTSSYYGVVSRHGGPKIRKWLDWQVHELIS